APVVAAEEEDDDEAAARRLREENAALRRAAQLWRTRADAHAAAHAGLAALVRLAREQTFAMRRERDALAARLAKRAREDDDDDDDDTTAAESDVESAVEDGSAFTDPWSASPSLLRAPHVSGMSAFTDPWSASPSLLRAPAGPLPPSLSRARAPGHRASTISLPEPSSIATPLAPPPPAKRRKQVHTWTPSPGGAMLIPHAPPA
ncbi:hypothetical protein FA95DRAFT_1574795, partial [Auriscalpium vulgare]